MVYLEYRGIRELLGELKARHVMEFWSTDHYTWIYKIVLERSRDIGNILVNTVGPAAPAVDGSLRKHCPCRSSKSGEIRRPGGAQVTILFVNMRRTLRSTLAVLLMCPAAFAAQQAARQPGKASVEGVVLRADSGEPLSRVQVTLRRISDQQENEIPRLLTQDNGKFSFENLEPGQFELTVARNGYARHVYGQGIAGGRGHPITLAVGQALKGITFRMVQGGVISGRVRDFRGEAVAGYQVFLMKSEYTADGKRRLTDAAGTVTDDRGEYRLYWIPPAVTTCSRASS